MPVLFFLRSPSLFNYVASPLRYLQNLLASPWPYRRGGEGGTYSLRLVLILKGRYMPEY